MSAETINAIAQVIILRGVPLALQLLLIIVGVELGMQALKRYVPRAWARIEAWRRKEIDKQEVLRRGYEPKDVELLVTQISNGRHRR